jgi:phenol hydroxylase P3 protein
MRVERDPERIPQRDILFTDGCTWTFDRDPEKYLQVWLAMHQIYRRNRREYAIPEALASIGVHDGDNREYQGSPDYTNTGWRSLT